MKVAITLAALCCVPALAFADGRGSGSGDAVQHAVIEIKPVPGHPFKELAIENPLGDIRVEGHDGDGITVETWKFGPDEDVLDRLRVSLVPNPDGTVHLMTTADGGREVKPVSRSAVRIDVVIHAPRNTRIDAGVSSGKLIMANLDAGGELDTSSGPIQVNNVSGELVTHTVSGKTSIAQAFGSIDAATVSSDLVLDTIGGDRLVASASKGQIDGRRVRSREIELTTTDGRISLEGELALTGHMVISSLHGDIDVRLRSHGVGTVRARGVKVDFGGMPVVRQGDWAMATIGHAPMPMTAAAMVELQSRFANVQFAIVQ
ncbi:MAG TPA: DUF4097 family beta strand repeat-containing protein [Kofleriaceae bacterium]